MKKIVSLCTILSIILFNTSPCFASWGKGYKYVDGGGIYSNVTFPKTVGKNIDNKSVDLSNLKKGESGSMNILYLFEIGDSGINAAAKQGNIKKIHYVETKNEKIYIPLLFFPIYVKGIKTVVYGE